MRWTVHAGCAIRRERSSHHECIPCEGRCKCWRGHGPLHACGAHYRASPREEDYALKGEYSETKADMMKCVERLGKVNSELSWARARAAEAGRSLLKAATGMRE